MKRLFDLTAACLGLLVLAPVMAAIWLFVRLVDRGPGFYRAERAGLGGKPITMLKFRTMRHEADGSTITSGDDDRITVVGRILRKSKMDELPQLFSVVKGDMSIVGPRPESLAIVENYYTDAQRVTLSVRPGLASPGSVYNYTHGEDLLAGGDAEAIYVEQLLPTKLALELAYCRSRSFTYDLRIIGRTLLVIVQKLGGRTDFPDPPELAKSLDQPA